MDKPYPLGRNRVPFTFCIAAALILSGCVGLFIDKYGYVASDTNPVRDDRSAVFIPKNAPSISQGFKPHPKGETLSAAHNGIDIFCKSGTPVIAPASGTVIKSYFEPVYGRRIVIEHGQDKTGLVIKTNYFHLKKHLVKKGDRVVRGQQIGLLGMTGLLAGFPHLHFEVQVRNISEHPQFRPMNPHRFWADGVGIVTCFDNSKHWEEKPFKITYPVPCHGVDWQ